MNLQHVVLAHDNAFPHIAEIAKKYLLEEQIMTWIQPILPGPSALQLQLFRSFKVPTQWHIVWHKSRPRPGYWKNRWQFSLRGSFSGCLDVASAIAISHWWGWTLPTACVKYHSSTYYRCFWFRNKHPTFMNKIPIISIKSIPRKFTIHYLPSV